jgi:branched-subunit amino acid ABC-type transport system permease component
MIYITFTVFLALFAVYLILYHTKLGRRIIDFIVNGLNDF